MANLRGIHLGFARAVPLPDRLRMIRGAGYDCTSLWWPEADGDLRRLRDSVPDAARALGLDIDHLHVPYRGCDALWDTQEHARAACVERHVRYVVDCARHGVACMVMHVTLKTRAERDRARGIESMRQIAERAEDKGIVVAIENTRDAAAVATLLEAIDSPALGLCYDNAHDTLYSDAPGMLFETCAERLVTTHLSDGDGRLDRHWLPGDGVFAFDATLDAMAQCPDVACVIEAVTRETGGAAEAFLARGYAWLTENLEFAASPRS